MDKINTEQKLWTPDTHQHHLYEVPSKDTLNNYWQEQYSHNEVLQLPEDLYGVCRNPDTAPTAFISVDLCEVIRETGLGVIRIKNGDVEHFIQDENEITDYGIQHIGFDKDAGATSFIVQELMSLDQITPVPHAEAIASVLRSWRAQNAYVIANTSTLEGCELPTVKFLADYFPDCFDGIVFPRNHDGNGKLTKAGALETVGRTISDAGYDVTNIPAIMIEDTSHHAKTFRTHFPDSSVFMPAYEWNASCEDPTLDITRVDRSLGTVGTFLAVREHLASLKR